MTVFSSKVPLVVVTLFAVCVSINLLAIYRWKQMDTGKAIICFTGSVTSWVKGADSKKRNLTLGVKLQMDLQKFQQSAILGSGPDTDLKFCFLRFPWFRNFFCPRLLRC